MLYATVSASSRKRTFACEHDGHVVILRPVAVYDTEATVDVLGPSCCHWSRPWHESQCVLGSKVANATSRQVGSEAPQIGRNVPLEGGRNALLEAGGASDGGGDSCGECEVLGPVASRP